jgi:hypothetical protein
MEIKPLRLIRSYLVFPPGPSKHSVARCQRSLVKEGLTLGQGTHQNPVQIRISRRLLHRGTPSGHDGFEGGETNCGVPYVGWVSLGVQELPVLKQGVHILPLRSVHSVGCFNEIGCRLVL